jgi:hypothetical protein
MLAYSLYAETVEIELKLFRGTDWPKWSFEQPYIVISTTENDHIQNIKVRLQLGSTDTNITLNNFGKSVNDTVIEHNEIVRDQAIEIQKIWVNGMLLELLALQTVFEFYPDYQQSDWEYANQNGISLPICRNETKIFYNGCWRFKFDQPFFHWYNNKLVAGLDSMNHWVKQSHLGLADDSQLQRLDKLLDQLSQ